MYWEVEFTHFEAVEQLAAIYTFKWDCIHTSGRIQDNPSGLDSIGDALDQENTFTTSSLTSFSYY